MNWLSFLNKYKLHGILCDDMGLGKTLQSICILAGDHYLRYWEQTAQLHRKPHGFNVNQDQLTLPQRNCFILKTRGVTIHLKNLFHVIICG